MDLKKAEPFICSLDIHKKYLLPLFHLYSVCDATWKVSIDCCLANLSVDRVNNQFVVRLDY
jgi:hypothetical protein